MVLRFWYEFAFGVITLISVLIFGPKGMVAMVLIALIPIIMRVKKIKTDEREKQLFFKSTQYIINGIVVLIIISVFVFGVKLKDLSDINSNTLAIGATLFMIVVSTVRLFFYYKN